MSIEGPAYITTFIGKRLDEFDKKKFTRKHIKIVHTCIIEWFELRPPYYLRKELYQTLYKKDCMGKQLLFCMHIELIVSLSKHLYGNLLFICFIWCFFFLLLLFTRTMSVFFNSKRLFFLYLQSETFLRALSACINTPACNKLETL